MTSPISSGMRSGADSKVDEEIETEERPIKRARTSPNSTANPTTSTVPLTAVRGAAAIIDATGLGLNFPTQSRVSSSNSSSRRDREQVAVSTTTNETGNSFVRSSRMFVFRRAGRARGRFLDYSSQQTDSDTLGDGWTYGIGSEEETGSSGAEDDERHNRTDLEWRWDEASKSKACTLANHNTEVRFHLDYSCGTAAARGMQPISEGQHYWEIKMISAVYGTDMMIGLGTKQVNMGKFSHLFCSMLGIDNNGESCGLSYTGRFHSGGMGKMYCTKYGQGTVIGVYLDMWFGTITFFKNGKCLGVASKGLLGKLWYPMVSSTAARSSMRLVKARSFPSSLQFWCCSALRKAIPPDLSVLEALEFPPGLRVFLEDNLSWLLGAHTSRAEVECKSKGTQTILSTTAVHQQQRIRAQQS
ncbi:SPRY domain-containing SOCS box protein 3-like [Amphiura filiformis]|uniref:SPRY domain-containing SOCS box protein 3-like n=1 Tax=Amphiura filiformis TaxID=82378 RepID=UPI003B217840